MTEAVDKVSLMSLLTFNQPSNHSKSMGAVDLIKVLFHAFTQCLTQLQINENQI